MVFLWIYTIVLCLLFIYFIKRKMNVLLIILSAFYSFIGIMCLICMYTGILSPDNLTAFPFIFLLVVYLLFFIPFIKTKQRLSCDNVDGSFTYAYVIFLYFYIFFTLLCLFNFVPQVFSLISRGDWRINYDSQILDSNGSGATFYYYNSAFYIATQISGYTSLVALIVSFINLKNRKRSILSFVVIALYLLRSFCTSMYASSRGSIFSTAFLLIALFFFFYKNISKTSKIIVWIGAIVASVFIVSYVYQVTVARFWNTNAIESIIRYFGHSPIVFDRNVATITRLSYGKMTVGALFGDSLINQYEVGGSWGNSFYTFVGWLYIDWGVFGTLIISLAVMAFMKSITKKRRFKVSDLMMIFYFYDFLFIGGLVIGPQQIISILVNFVLWAFLRFVLESPSLKIVKYKNNCFERNRII